MYDVERMSFAIWSPYTTYSINDTVEYVSFTYSALSVNTNKIPTDFPLVWKFRGSASGGGTVTNPLTSDLVATGFTVLNQSGNAPEEHSIRLSGSKVFNIVTTELTQLFTVDANSNVSVGATGNVATLAVGNASSAESNTVVSVQDIYGLAELTASAMSFTYGGSQSLTLLNIFTPQINLTDATGHYTVNLSSGNDDSTSGLTIITPVYEANYTNSEMRITAISSPPLRQVIINPNSILITNGVVATTITETSVTSASFVGTASTADAITATATNGSAVHYPTFVNSAGASKSVQIDNGLTPLTYVPSTGVFTATSFVGALTGNSDTSTRATNIAGGLGGSIPYQTAVNATSLLANGTAGQVLTSNGTTLAPSWGAPVGMVKVGTVSVAIVGSASAQNLSFTSLFTSAYRNYKIILRPTTQVSFSAYPSYSLQAYLGTSVPTTASLSGFELNTTSTVVVTPIYTASGTISSAPLIFAVSCITNRENQFDISNVGYAVTQSQQVTLMCKSVYNNPGVSTGTSDRTINSTALSGCMITGLVIQQTALGVGNNFTLEASVYGYT